MSWYSGGIDGLVSRIVQIISSIIRLIGVTYILAMFSPLIMLIIALVIVVNLIINAKSASMEAQFRKDLVGINRRFGYYFGLNMDFQYGKDVRIFGADRLITQRTKLYNKLFWANTSAMGNKQRMYHTIAQFNAIAQMAVLHLYLAARIIAGYIVFSDYIMLVSAAEVFSGSINAILEQFVQMRTAASFMSEYKKFMDYPDVVNKSDSKIPSEESSHTIQFNNVSFHYPNREELILDNINLTITPNEKLSVVGLNGAGKTTFIKLLCRLYDPTEGNITLDGVDIREYDYDEYMKLFAVVFQDFSILSFTVRENIALEASDEHKGSETEQTLIEKVNDSIRRAGVDEKINSLEKGIDTSVYKNFDKEGMEFSGGETQKLAIARAIYKDAPIVVLDEPTAALDPIAEYEIYSRFDNLIGRKTAIYISHRLSSCRFCDIIAVFHEGKIIEYGSHAELAVLDGRYSEMWNAQAQYYV
jgi:ABC-type multidrug transport system fused ATPase/permease subunit